MQIIFLIVIIPIIEYNILIMEVSIMDYLTATELSRVWNISTRRIGVLCTEGRVDGAIKKGKMWMNCLKHLRLGNYYTKNNL